MGVVADTVSNVVNDVVQSAGDAGSSVADTGSQVVSDVGNTVSTAVSDTVQAIGDAGANIDDVVNEQIPGGWATVGAVAATIATAGAASGTLAAEAGADAGAEAGAAEAGAEGAAVADAGASSVADAGLSMVPPDAIPPEPLGPELDPTGSLANPNTINPLDALKAAGTGAAKGALTNVAVDAITGRPITPSGLAIAGLTGGVGGAAGNVAGQLGAGTIGSGIAAGTAGGTIGAALNNGNVGQGAVSGALSGLSSGITGNMLSGLDPVTTATGQSVASTLANAAKTGNTNNLAENLVGGALASAGLTSGTNALLNSGSPLPDYTNDVPYSPNAASQPLAETPNVESPLTQLASEQPTQKVDLTTPSPLLSAVTQPITTPDTTYAPLASTNTTGTVSDVGGGYPLVPINNGNTTKDEVTIIDPSTGKSSNSNVAIPSDATPVEGNPNEYQGADGTTYTIDPTTGNVSSTPPPIDISTSNPLDTPPNPPYQDGTISAQNTSSDTGGTNPVGSNDSSGSSSSGTSNQPSVDLTPINNQIGGSGQTLDTTNKTIAENQAQTEEQLNNLSDAQKAQVASQVAMGVSLTAAINSVQSSLLKQSTDASNAQIQSSALSNNQAQSQPSSGNIPTPISGQTLAGAPVYNTNTQILQQLQQLDPKLLSKIAPHLANTNLTQSGLSALASPQQSNTPQSDPYASLMQTMLSSKDSSKPSSGLSNTLMSSGLSALNGNVPGYKKGGSIQHNEQDKHMPEFITGSTGHYVKGKGDGQSDDIPAMLADGEYVFDADTVAQLGNGSSDAGAKLLDHFRESLREHKRSAPTDKIPPKASPLMYMKEALRRHTKG